MWIWIDINITHYKYDLIEMSIQLLSKNKFHENPFDAISMTTLLNECFAMETPRFILAYYRIFYGCIICRFGQTVIKIAIAFTYHLIARANINAVRYPTMRSHSTRFMNMTHLGVSLIRHKIYRWRYQYIGTTENRKLLY